MSRCWSVLVVFVFACGSERRFPLRDPMWQDTDLASVNVRCHVEATKKDPHHIACAPKQYISPLYWDGADNIVFRPLSETLGVVTSGESVNVNSVDEVPDSAWFTNRIGRGEMTVDEVSAGACKPEQMLDPDHAPDGTWVIDKGKAEGSTGGFRITVPGKGKYMVKTEDAEDKPERQSAASAIGVAIFHAAGYYTSCEQVVYLRPSVLKLEPGLTTQANLTPKVAFDRAALDKLLAHCTKRGALVRVIASAWVEGHNVGPYTSRGVRADDPNDIIPHENRRELRGMGVLAAWIARYDAREENALDTWMADKKAVPDSSPGHLIHYQLDTSEALGGDWGGDGSISKRLGKSYVFDWGDIARDFLTLGIPTRSWETVRNVPGRALFGYFNISDFKADAWKNEYPNIAFSRMTERDAAWAARIVAHFTPEMIEALARLGKFTEASNTRYLASVLEGRLERVLERYLLRLSPITDLRVEAGSSGLWLCGVDLAEWRHVRASSLFRYTARSFLGAQLEVARRSGGGICVALQHDARARYKRVVIDDGVAKGKLVAHLYDLGDQGFKLVGLERPPP